MSAATKAGTSRPNARTPIIALPKIIFTMNETMYEIAKPTAVTMNCADIVDERRFVGDDSPTIMMIMSFVA